MIELVGLASPLSIGLLLNDSKTTRHARTNERR